MSAQLYYHCSCGTRPKQHKTSLVKHARKYGCNPPPVPKKRKVNTSLAEDFLDSIPDDMKDVDPRWCYAKGCFKDDLGYGILGGNKTSCKQHAVDNGYVKLEGLCTFQGCTKRGHNSIQGTRFQFCAEHLNQLIARGLPQEDIKKQKSKTCSHSGCGIAASFDGRMFCETHSPTGISDDKRVCAVDGCGKKRPTFGYPGKPRTHCADHKEFGMYSRKLCITDGCILSASYGMIGEVVVHCKKHMVEGETLINNRKCVHTGCDKQPAFGDPVTRKRSHCKTHAPDEFVDVFNKRCAEENCHSLVKDSTPFCVAHGGGKKCTLACCTFGGPYPQYGNPDDGSRICAFGARALMEDALLNDDIERARMLQTNFKRKTMMVLNQQSAFRAELEKKYWKHLDTCIKVYFDETVTDKPKIVGDLRPDIFYLWEFDGKKMAIHIEYDEGSSHEDDDERLKYISDTSGTTGNVYVIRVDGKATGSSGALCSRSHKGSVVFFEVNELGREVACKVADAVIDRIQWIEEGLGPSDTRPSKVYF
jgi:hypothetical protein